jgi:hypothetical protein
MSTTTQTQHLERSNHTGLSASTSSEKYDLDEFDDSPILLYKYRGQLETSSQKDLCAWLDKAGMRSTTTSHSGRQAPWNQPNKIVADGRLRCTKKRIPRGTSYVEVRRHDLFLPPEKERYSSTPNFNSSLASIKVPFPQYLSNLFFGNYEDLYIVSPETTPSGSRTSSPTSTWGQDSQEESRLGADAEPAESGSKSNDAGME